MATPPLRFDRGQLATLRTTLGATDIKRVLPILEDAANAYRPAYADDSRNSRETRDEAIRHQSAAERVAKAADRLNSALDKALPIAAKAAALGYLQLSSQKMFEIEVVSLKGVRQDIVKLSEMAAQWERRARARATGKRGRPVTNRKKLARWVASHFRRLGIHFTWGREGKLARTLQVVYELAHIPVPKDLMPDLLHAKRMFAVRK